MLLLLVERILCLGSCFPSLPFVDIIFTGSAFEITEGFISEDDRLFHDII